MPTNLPLRRKVKADLFVLFAIVLGVSFFVIEIVDPAPMQVEASEIASP